MSKDFDKSGSSLGNSGEGTLAERARQKQEDDLRENYRNSREQKNEILQHFETGFRNFLEIGISKSLNEQRDGFSFMVNIPHNYSTSIMPKTNKRYHFRNAQEMIADSMNIESIELISLVENTVTEEFEKKYDHGRNFVSFCGPGGTRGRGAIFPVVPHPSYKTRNQRNRRGTTEYEAGFVDGLWGVNHPRQGDPMKLPVFGIFSFGNSFNSISIIENDSKSIRELLDVRTAWEPDIIQLSEEDFDPAFGQFIHLPYQLKDYWNEQPSRAGIVVLSEDGKARLCGEMMMFTVNW